MAPLRPTSEVGKGGLSAAPVLGDWHLPGRGHRVSCSHGQLCFSQQDRCVPTKGWVTNTATPPCQMRDTMALPGHLSRPGVTIRFRGTAGSHSHEDGSVRPSGCAILSHRPVPCPYTPGARVHLSPIRCQVRGSPSPAADAVFSVTQRPIFPESPKRVSIDSERSG